MPGEPERPHAGAHGLGVDRQPLGLELRGDAPVPVAPPVLFVAPRDRIVQRVGPPRRRALELVVEGGARHPRELQQEPEAVRGP